MKYILTLSLLLWFGTLAPVQSQDVYSIGTGNVPGEVAHYASLKAACDSLNAYSGALTADRIYYITSSLTEPANVNIGLNTNGHSITFKPYTGTTDTITFTQAADNVGLSGGWVIGVKNLTTSSTYNYGLSQHDSTENITIDGSNTVGGTTRDLSIFTASGISGNTNPIRIYGRSHYITVKNVVVATGQSVSYAIVVYLRTSTNASPDTVGDYVPDNITIDNCDLTNNIGVAGQGIAITASGTPTHFPTSVVFSNNKITVMTRGIFLNNAGNTDVFGNSIYVNQTSTGYQSYGIWAYVVGLSTNVLNIYNNKVQLLQTANLSSGSYGIEGIWVGAQGVYNVYNNTVTGFNLPNGAQGISVGIGVSTGATTGVTANVYYNSVYEAGTNTAGATNPTQAAFYASLTGASGTRVVNVEDNIFMTDIANYTSYATCITATNVGTINSDYNLLYANGANGKIGSYMGTDETGLSDWQTASSQDGHSLASPPHFVSASDLHIDSTAFPASAAYHGGTPITGITKDQDGKTRDATHPCIGAYEFTPKVSGIMQVTIAEATKVDPITLVPLHSVTADTLLIFGVVTTPNIQGLSGNTSYCVQDTTAGVDVFAYGQSTFANFIVGDSVFAIGTVQQYHGLVEFVPAVLDSAHLSLLKHKAALPKPKLLTYAEYDTNALAYMSQLVEVDSLYKSSGVWPGPATNKSLYMKTATSTDSLQLYINKNTSVAGSAEPVYPVNLVGVVSQYTSSVPPNNGFEIIPRTMADFGILTVPPTPSVVGLNGAQYQRADTLVFKWHAVMNYIMYNFQLSKDSMFTTFVVNDSSLTDTTKKVTGLDHLTKYFWHVRAFDAGGSSAFSANDSFVTIIAAPAAPAPVSPHGTGIIRKPMFVWHPSALAVTYNLQVSTASSFTANLIDVTLPAVDTTMQITDTLDANATYYWRVGAIDTGGVTYSSAVLFKTGTIVGVDDNAGIPKEYALFQNYPNPFNPSTTIHYDIPKNAYVKVVIYDILGRAVVTLVDGLQLPSHYSLQWNPIGLSSGVYFCRIQAQSQDGSGKFSAIKKLLFMK